MIKEKKELAEVSEGSDGLFRSKHMVAMINKCMLQDFERKLRTFEIEQKMFAGGKDEDN